VLVSVTGGTGLVGAHSVAAIIAAGHRVRLLARDESTVERALTPLGVSPGAVDVVAGDVLDEMRVERLMRGADAAIHLASVYSFDSRQKRAMRRTNERGTELVLAAARRSGAGPVVYVSTVGALFPARVINGTSPVGRPRETYLASKAAAEAVARRHQEEGAPVVISYPPALLGPHDPKLGDQTLRLRNTLRGLMPIWPLGGFPLGDVRDTAALHASLLETSAPGRHFGPGHYVSTRDYLRTVREVTGRLLPAMYLPAWSVVPVGLFTNLVQHVWPWKIPAEYGAIYTAACRTRVDENASTNGIPARPLLETFTDTVRWLLAEELISERAAGAAVRDEAVVA
jgi:nucleoside-diphosphate-sugar epimerase